MLRINVTKRLRDYTLEADIDTGGRKALVLMGSNGSGKTTLINMLSGIIAPDSGAIEVSGKLLFDSSASIDVPPEKRNIGYVFQSYALFPHMSVYDNAAFGLRMRKLPEDKIEHKVRGWLEPLDMWNIRDEKALKLSGGQKQKVALARAMVIEPDLLLLDEPLNALDAATATLMRGELKKALNRSGTPSIIITHSLKDAVELGDVVCVMDCGKVAVCGRPEDILRKGVHQFMDSLLL